MRIKTAVLLAAAAFLSFGAADTAHAGKPQFQRTKPHVNVGTIGRDSGPVGGGKVWSQMRAASNPAPAGPRPAPSGNPAVHNGLLDPASRNF